MLGVKIKSLASVLIFHLKKKIVIAKTNQGKKEPVRTKAL